MLTGAHGLLMLTAGVIGLYRYSVTAADYVLFALVTGDTHDDFSESTCEIKEFKGKIDFRGRS